MIAKKEVLRQLRCLGVKSPLLGRSEIKELPNILVPHEQLRHVVMGWCESGLALLCATNRRVLLVDKKPLFLTVEDLRYDMIAEIKYQYRLLEASIELTYSGRVLGFKTWNQRLLRKLVAYIQDTVTQVETAHSNFGYNVRDEQHAADLANRPILTEPVYGQLAIWPSRSETLPIEHYRPTPGTSLPKNPYQTGRQVLRRHKISRFVTQTQLNS